MNTIISHLYQNNGSWVIQSNDDHQKGVAALCEQFASEFGYGSWGKALGLLHDKGKESFDFQNYIKKSSGIDPNAPSYDDKNHAWVGAKIADIKYPKSMKVLSRIILGHHAGLCDYTVLGKYNDRKIPAEISQPSDCNQLDTPHPFNPIHFHHLIRVLYSCLVDADYLDTERFMDNEKNTLRERKLSLNDLAPVFLNFIQSLNEKAKPTEVNKIRRLVQDRCREMASEAQGIYSLTVPTGGGKTLSSLLWGILHAMKHGKKRIIIAIPYTSIISQTAQLLKSIFGEENVLEHHSNYLGDDINEDANKSAMTLAIQNWDCPIIVTTNVQLFESMFASHPSRCRKLHNIVNSVIILDEAQMLPGERLQPIVDALKAYNELFGTSVLLTTASQPTLEGAHKGHDRDLDGFSKVTEIIPADFRLHEHLQRVNLEFIDAPMSYDELAQYISNQHRVLCVVNTRQDAGEIYDRLQGSDCVCHLSRMMCSEHIDKTLREIKDKLANTDEPVRIISTQLIEAGVDIDLPVVMRQEAGLDSILQAAGRCNREGKMADKGSVFVFKIDGRQVPRGTMRYANDARINMPVQEDWFSPSAIKGYFTQFYSRINTFDKCSNEDGNIRDMLYNPSQLMFDTADREFNLIDSNGHDVIIEYNDEAEQLLTLLRNDKLSKDLFRKLNRYTVNISEKTFRDLLGQGMLETIDKYNYYVLSDHRQYDDKRGVILGNHWVEEILIL